jgi:hypothetical protein
MEYPMEYQGDGRPLSDAGMHDACAALDIAAPALWAVLSIETRGFGFLADRRPAILFERHIFHRFTNGRWDAVRPNLSNPLPGGYLGGADEYRRLESAATLDANAALLSASWGIGQIMGFNYQFAGFTSVAEMIAAMVAGEDEQLRATAAFIVGSDLAVPLQSQDWPAFARGYNGLDYQQNDYDTKLAAAFARYQAALPDISVRAAQTALLYLGLNPGPIDGFVGPRTRAAVVALQQRRELPVTGDLTADLIAELVAWAWP